MRVLTALLMLFSCSLLAQNQLSVDVHGVPKSEGKISVALYNQEEDFLKFDKVFKSDSKAAKQGVTSIALKGLPEGEYALAVFYDENGNDKLDTNWIGIPKEKVAFSNAKMKTFGPPKFKECVFQVSKDTKINVTL